MSEPQMYITYSRANIYNRIAEFSIEGWRLDRAKGDTEGMVLE